MYTAGTYLAVDSPRFQPLMLPPGQPPAQLIPANIAASPETLRILPLIVTTAISAIQQKVNNNRSRIHLFNQMAEHGYQNPYFQHFVQLVANLIDMGISEREARDPLQLVENKCLLAAEMQCVENFIQVPGLPQVLEQASIQSIQALGVPKYHVLMAKLNQFLRMRSGSMISSSTWNNGGAFAPQLPREQQGTWSAQSPNIAPSSALANQPSNPYHVYGSTHAAARPQSQDRTTYRLDVEEDSALARTYERSYGYSSPPAELPPARPQEQPSYSVVENPHVRNIREALPGVVGATALPPAPPASSEGVRLIHRNEPGVVFIPSAKYPFLPVFDPAKYDLFYTIDRDGAMRPVLTAFDEQERLTMDMDAHLQLSQFSTGARVPEAAAEQRRQELMAQLGSEEPDAVNLDMNLGMSDSATGGVTDHEIWMRAMIRLFGRKKKAEQDPNKVRIQLLKAVVVTPLITLDYQGDFIADVALSQTFNQAVQQMNAYKPDMSPVETAAGWHVNKRLTDRVNRYIHQRLGLAHLKIDSFVEDATQLVDYLRGKYGDAFAEALERDQAEIIADGARYADPEFRQDITRQHMTYELSPEDCPNIEVFYTLDAFIQIDLLASELQIPIEIKNLPLVVQQKSAPLLWAIGAVFTRVEDEATEPVSRKLLRTTDGVVFAMERSALDENSFLLSLT